MTNDSILGISEEHDAGVVLIGNGEIIFAANEERYSRKKLAIGFPKGALKKGLQEVRDRKLPLPKLVAVASNFHVGASLADWFSGNLIFEFLERFFSKTRLDRLLLGSNFTPKLIFLLGIIQRPFRELKLRKNLKKFGIVNPRIFYVDHHTSHAWGAYWGSGFKDALVVTMDGDGDGVAGKIFLGKQGSLKEKYLIPLFHSPGLYYLYATLILGYRLGREGKTTGLAAYGNPDKTFKAFQREFKYLGFTKGFVNYGCYRKEEIKRLKQLLSGAKREDVAAGAQKHLEKNLLLYIKDTIRELGRKKVSLAVSGGIFANVKLNLLISQIPEIGAFYVFPHMGDGGLALGAVLKISRDLGISVNRKESLFLGDDISEKEIKAVLKRYENRTKVTKPDNLEKYISNLLAQGKIVGIARGRMEFGPRALGNRSILSSAREKGIINIINERLGRDWFMPLAPLVQDKDVGKFFLSPKKVRLCISFMTLALKTRRKTKRLAPAIVHTDGTSRIQAVSEKKDPLIYKVLDRYKEANGFGIIINTSFNLHEEPIVRTAKDALKTFLKGRLDALVLDNYLVLRK